MDNIIDFSKYRIDAEKYQVNEAFDIDLLELVTSPEQHLDIANTVANNLLLNGNLSMSHVSRLLTLTKNLFHHVYLPFGLISSLAVRVCNADDGEHSVLLHVYNATEVRNLDTDNPPKYLMCIEASTPDMSGYDNLTTLLAENLPPARYQPILTPNQLFTQTMFNGIVSNLYTALERTGGFVRQGRSDGDECGLLLAFLPHSGTRALQISVLFDDIVEEPNT